MKNLQLCVDIEESSATMTAYTNMIEEAEMNQGKPRIVVQSDGLGVGCFVGSEFVIQIPKIVRESIKNHDKILQNRKTIEEMSKKTLVLMGFDLTKIENYIFGKTVAFALSYNADEEKALQMGFKALGRDKFTKFLSDKDLLNKFRNDPTRFNRFNEIIGHVYQSNIDVARKLAVDNWKKNLAKIIIEDSEQLKKLIEADCHLDGDGVQLCKEVALKFVQENLENLGLNK